MGKSRKNRVRDKPKNQGMDVDRDTAGGDTWSTATGLARSLTGTTFALCFIANKICFTAAGN